MAIVPAPRSPRVEPFTAVEFDLLDDQGKAVTLRVCNGGMATVMRNGLPYDPRLTNLPILLGSTITVTQYGSPVRAQPNAGVIQFRFDERIWIWTAYHWIGRSFRSYEGERPTPFAAVVDVDADMVLVYAGRVGGFSHDCFTASVQTTDGSLDLDNPLVTDFYDVTFPVGIQGKPRPTARGKFFSAQPVIVDEAAQIYELQSLPQGMWSIDEIRVGGVPWTKVVAPPKPGQWSPLNFAGVLQRLQLGSPPAGQDVRVDGTVGSYTIGQLITAVVTDAGGKVDAVAMGALDASTQLQQASLVTNTSPVNRLSALDDVVTAGGCWWGFNPLEQATGAAISIPDAVAKYKLTDVQINTISLNTIQPLAWRIRVGSGRNWQPESSFDDGVLQTDIAKWSSPAIVYEPHYENPNALTLESRAIDVPLLAGTSPNRVDAANQQARLIAAWGENRTVFDVTVWMRPEDINLYDTVEVEFMMVTGVFRIVSAIRAIGGNGPATLQLWGTLGLVPPGVPPLPSPASATPIITLSPSGVVISDHAFAGSGVSTISVIMSDGSAFTGILSVNIASSNYIRISGTKIILSRDLSPRDDGVGTFVILATQNGNRASALLTVAVGVPLPPPPTQKGWAVQVLMSGVPAGVGAWSLQLGVLSLRVSVPYGLPLDLTPTLSNLLAQYNALPPLLQADYNAVVGADPVNYNNGPGLQNKVNLVALLTGYNLLPPAPQALFDMMVSNNPAFDNTPSGVIAKTQLVRSLYASVIFNPDLTPTQANLLAQYASLSPGLQAIYNGVVGSDPVNFNDGPGLQNKVNLVVLLVGYGSLPPALQALYNATVSADTLVYNNTPPGIVNKLALVRSYFPVQVLLSPLDIVNGWASQIKSAPSSLGFAVTSTAGSTIPWSGSATMIITETPFNAATPISGNIGSPGSVTISPWP